MADLVRSSALLIGYGSVGRRHAAALADMFPSLAIVETDSAARERARAAHPTSKVGSALAELDAERFPWRDTVAVIATWGPSHARLFHELADLGVRSVLCEKPLASSAADADAMVARAAREGITLVVNHYLRYTGIAAALRGFAAEQTLGEPVALVGTGGAVCLATNGIHWIDFAAELFAVDPSSVTGSAFGEEINPRAPELLIVGGTAVWSFGSGREAVLSFNNRSSVALNLQVYFRDAVADVRADDGVVRIARRDRDAVAAYPAVTRCGPASELLFDGRLPDTTGAAGTGVRAIREAAGSGPVTASGRVGAAAVSAVIGALIAGRERRAIELPLSPGSPWHAEEWRIS